MRAPSSGPWRSRGAARWGRWCRGGAARGTRRRPCTGRRCRREAARPCSRFRLPRARGARDRARPGPRHVGGAWGKRRFAVAGVGRAEGEADRWARGPRAGPACRPAARRAASSGGRRRPARRRRGTPARSPCRTSSRRRSDRGGTQLSAPAIISAALAVSPSTSVATGPLHRSTPGGSGARSVSSEPSRRFIGKSGAPGMKRPSASIAPSVEPPPLPRTSSTTPVDGPTLALALAQDGAGQLFARGRRARRGWPRRSRPLRRIRCARRAGRRHRRLPATRRFATRRSPSSQVVTGSFSPARRTTACAGGRTSDAANPSCSVCS